MLALEIQGRRAAALAAENIFKRTARWNRT